MGDGLKRHRWITGLAVLVLLAALLALSRNRIHFDFGLFRSQLALADWRKIALAVAYMYACYIVRSIRWVWLLRHSRKVSFFPLLGAQIMGFAAVGLFGRVADLTRPYLTSRKTGLPLTLQIAVYVMERLFDFGLLALLFGSAIFLSHLHSEFLRNAALVALSATLIGTVFLFALRLAGEAVASFFERIFTPMSKKFGLAAGHKLRTFHAGLGAMRSFSDFVVAVALSAGLWGLMAMAYFETARAFIADRQLSTINFWQCIPLLAISSGASFIQLPILGWFSQIGIVAAGMSALLRVPASVSTAWSATLLFVTLLSPVPAGLIWAQVEGISLRKVTAESEHATEDIDLDERPQMPRSLEP